MQTLRSKYGQVTLFVMVGLVLLIVIWLGFTLRHRDVDATQDQGDEIRGALDDAQTNAHIISCLDAAAQKELMAIGKSGGASAVGMMITPHKSKFTIGTITQNEKKVDVLYGLMQNRRKTPNLVPYQTLPPFYPADPLNVSELKAGLYINSPTDTEKKTLLAFQEGFFGQTGFVPLCDKNGPNGPDALTLCKSYPNTPPGTPDTMSLQEALERQIVNDVKICVDTTYFTSKGYEPSDPKVVVEFSDSAVLMNLTYPLKKGTEWTSVTYNKRYPVRLIATAQFAQEFAKRMTVDPTYDPTVESAYKKFNNYREGFSVTRQRLSYGELESPANPLDFAKTGDLIIIKDEGSTIQGVPFTFQFLVERRYPMLEYIPTGVQCLYIVCNPDCNYQFPTGTFTPITGLSPDGIDVRIHKNSIPNPGCTILATDTDGFSDSQILLT